MLIYVILYSEQSNKENPKGPVSFRKKVILLLTLKKEPFVKKDIRSVTSLVISGLVELCLRVQ